ncbi:MAG: ribosomal-processing cysteine protease Prp [Treponemataceae bacterium]|nr:ribosomal-processing cysteine protease Prp [Treponemataceae bacterium]
MISVRLVREADGAFVSCTADGHSGYAEPGSDIVCSAVSVLIRTAARVLSEMEGVELGSNTGGRGHADFFVKTAGCALEAKRCLVFAGRFLAAGLDSIAKEFPKHLELLNQTV